MNRQRSAWWVSSFRYSTSSLSSQLLVLLATHHLAVVITQKQLLPMSHCLSCPFTVSLQQLDVLALQTFLQATVCPLVLIHQVDWLVPPFLILPCRTSLPCPSTIVHGLVSVKENSSHKLRVGLLPWLKNIALSPFGISKTKLCSESWKELLHAILTCHSWWFLSCLRHIYLST